jgi:hypothetical protein
MNVQHIGCQLPSVAADESMQYGVQALTEDGGLLAGQP